MGEVVQLKIAPKTLSGSRRNVSWTISYVPAIRKWAWHVEVKLAPATFTGEADSQAEAQKEVDKYLNTMTV